MIVLELTALVSTLLIIVFNFVIYVTLNRIKDIQLEDQNFLSISVLVAAKNEENNVNELIDSFSAINYPENKFEIIIADDASTDDTYNRLSELTKSKQQFRIVRIDKKNIPGKKGVLQKAIELARFDYVVVTDADCTVPNNWLRYYSQQFNKGFEFVFGQVVFNKAGNFTNKLACFENLRSKILNFTFAKLRLPFSTGGANIGYKKELIEKIDGFDKIAQVQSGDDDLLIKELQKRKIKFGFIPNPEVTVKTNAKTNFADYLKQKARHTSTSLHYSFLHKAILVLWHVPNILIIFSALLIPYNDLFVLPVLLKLLMDSFNLASHQESFNYKFNFFEHIFLSVTYEILLVLHFINQFRFSKRWE